MPKQENPDILLIAMKKDIHPQVNTSATVTCVCGNTFTTISTKDDISLEICSNCHPFYTGKQKFVDTEGRIEKFEKKRKLSAAKKATVSSKKSKKNKEDTTEQDNAKQPTLKELLEQARAAN